MRVGCCFSGGTDSALAALLLAPHCDVTLVSASFGETQDWHHAEAAAEALGFPFTRVSLDPAVLQSAVDQAVADGFPRNAIQAIHEHTLDVLASGEYEGPDFDAVADGTRRDDRVPRVDRPLAQSIEDRHDVAHLAPLAGIGRGTIDELAAAKLQVETGPSETIDKGDYETELRAAIAADHDQATVADVFPAHTQSRVTGRR